MYEGAQPRENMGTQFPKHSVNRSIERRVYNRNFDMTEESCKKLFIGQENTFGCSGPSVASVIRMFIFWYPDPQYILLVLLYSSLSKIPCGDWPNITSHFSIITQWWINITARAFTQNSSYLCKCYQGIFKTSIDYNFLSNNYLSNIKTSIRLGLSE